MTESRHATARRQVNAWVGKDLPWQKLRVRCQGKVRNLWQVEVEGDFEQGRLRNYALAHSEDVVCRLVMAGGGVALVFESLADKKAFCKEAQAM